MNQKFIDVLMKFVTDKSGFQEIYDDGSEYYFRFKGHIFSILKRSGHDVNEYGNYSIFVYPQWKHGLKELAYSYEQDPNPTPTISYHESQFNNININGTNISDLFSELYTFLQEKNLGVDNVFDDILDSFDL
jgi:hypothetical protein